MCVLRRLVFTSAAIPPSVPSELEDLSSKSQSEALELQWTAPVSPNGIVSYIVSLCPSVALLYCLLTALSRVYAGR